MTVKSLKSGLLNRLRQFLFVGTRLEPWLKKVVAGSRAGSWRLKLLPNHDLFPNPSPRTLLKNSRRLNLNLGEWMEWAAYFEIEDPTILTIQNLLRPGDVALDIGTNIGSMALGMAKKVGARGRVFGFEPSTDRFEKCRERLEFERISNVEVSPLALGAKEGRIQMESPDSKNLGRNKITSKPAANIPSAECTTLDQWARDRGVEHIDFIKIDVEGFEQKVWSGMRKTLSRHKPILFIEIIDANLREHGSSAVSFLEEIRRSGYDVVAASGENLSQTIPSHFDAIARPSFKNEAIV